MSAEKHVGGIEKVNSDGTAAIEYDLENNKIKIGSTLVNKSNLPTAGSSDIQIENFGDGKKNYTKISFTDLAVGTAADGAALGFGVKLLDLPAGVQKYDAVYQEVALEGVAAIQADTPEIGLGTVVASGAVSVLGGTATFEDVLEGSAVADCNGTTAIDSDLAVNQLVAVGAAKSLYLNVADTWAAGGGALTATGTVILEWTDLTV